MKTIIKKAGILYMALSFGLTSCETFDFGQEMGQKVISINSDDDLVFTGTGEHGIYIRQLRRLAPYRP